MTTPNTSRPSAARERILKTASRLFYRDGLRATGIDKIIAESGVAKMSFYRHFPSKSDLIAAFLTARHVEWMKWFREEVDARIGRNGQRLDAVVDVLAEWFADPDFRGCAFINTVAEAGMENGQDRAIALEHKDELSRYLASLAQRLGADAPEQVAAAAMIVVEGLIVRAQMGADEGALNAARALLRNLTATSSSTFDLPGGPE